MAALALDLVSLTESESDEQQYGASERPRYRPTMKARRRIPPLMSDRVPTSSDSNCSEEGTQSEDGGRGSADEGHYFHQKAARPIKRGLWGEPDAHAPSLRDLSPDLLALEAELQQQQSLQHQRRRRKRGSRTRLSSSQASDSDTTGSDADSEHDRRINHTPALTETSTSSGITSRSASIDSFNSYLPALYADCTPAPSPIDSLTSSPVVARTPMPWANDAAGTELTLASLHLSEATRNNSTSTLTEVSAAKDIAKPVAEDEADTRTLSLPLKICAFALALLPIPTSILTAIGQSGASNNPPPLPVEHPADPPTYLPRHRSTSSLSHAAMSPKQPSSTELGGFLPLTPAVNMHTGKRAKRRVCFHKVTVITSPQESEYSDEDESECDR